MHTLVKIFFICFCLHILFSSANAKRDFRLIRNPYEASFLEIINELWEKWLNLLSKLFGLHSNVVPSMRNAAMGPKDVLNADVKDLMSKQCTLETIQGLQKIAVDLFNLFIPTIIKYLPLPFKNFYS